MIYRFCSSVATSSRLETTLMLAMVRYHIKATTLILKQHCTTNYCPMHIPPMHKKYASIQQQAAAAYLGGGGGGAVQGWAAHLGERRRHTTGVVAAHCKAGAGVSQGRRRYSNRKKGAVRHLPGGGGGARQGTGSETQGQGRRSK